MNQILILYYSGVGNTKFTAQFIHSNIAKVHKTDIFSIEDMPLEFDISTYDALVIGFPTIHAEPAKPIVTFFHNLSSLKRKTPAFLFTTCGLYSANTLRIFSSLCIKKNIIPILCRSYRCSATDGILLAPFMSFWFQQEKNLHEKITRDCLQLIHLLEIKYKADIPKIKLYSILNLPNKWLGQRFPLLIYLHKSSCSKCQKCIINCPSNALSKDTHGYPFYKKVNCIHCLRCIHHCPNLALSISSKKTPTKTIYVKH